MKSLNEFITESVKFSNFTPEELEAMKQELITLQDQYKKVLSKSWENKVQKSGFEMGKKYFLYFDNPFADSYKVSKTPDTTTKLDNEVDKVFAIGVADKFGRLFIQNLWEGNDSVFIQYKKAEKKTTKDGKSYMTKEGWYITRKELTAYKVHTWYSGKRGESAFHFPSDKATKGMWDIPVDHVYCVIDIADAMPKMIEKVTNEIEEKAKLKAKAEAKEAENKAFWDKVNKYENIGIANAWEETPEILKKANDDKDAEWTSVSLNRFGTYNMYICHTYKFYYTVDSSD